MCLGPWSEHGNGTGGFYQCNVFDESTASKALDSLRGETLTSVASARAAFYEQRYRAQIDSAQFCSRLVWYYSGGELRAAAEIAFKMGRGAGGGAGGGAGPPRGGVAGESAGAMEEKESDARATLCSALDVLAAGARAVVKARHVLAWSFAFAFFVEDGIHFDLCVHLRLRPRVRVRHPRPRI
jgi:hypothetical protein